MVRPKGRPQELAEGRHPLGSGMG